MRFWGFTTNIFRSSKPLKRTKKATMCPNDEQAA